MLPPNSQLPAGIGEAVASTTASPNDNIVSLKEELDSVQSALDEERAKNSKLESEIHLLRDNTQIKKDAVRYAKVFMVIIPIFCLMLLIISATIGLFFSFEEWDFEFSWSIEIQKYAQAAFVVAPVLFVATVLGFLLKGVFQTSSQADEVGLANLRQSLGDRN